MPSAPAFTVIEMVVVITVIVIILALAVPGLSAMNAEARLTAARQTVSGVLTRAYYLSVADTCMTAVRFMPAQWDIGQEAKRTLGGRQRPVVYRYVGTTTDPNNVNNVTFGEYFQRAADTTSVDLPDDVWVAPLEALSKDRADLPIIYEGQHVGSRRYDNFGRDFVLDGKLSTDPSAFAYDADRNDQGTDGANFLNADDFLIVFDPRSGMVAGTPQPFRLRAYAPGPPAGCGYETDCDPSTANRYYQRYNFTGVVIYRREAFFSLGATATGQDRQDLLRASGRPYMAHRFSGALRSGVPGQ